jgi:flagellar basal body-associated protein FliL
MEVLSKLGTAIADNFVLIVVLVTLIILVIAIARTIVKVKSSKQAARLAEIGLDSKKLEILSKKAYFEGLRTASVILSDEERERVETIKADSAVLSRRSVALMNEVEERTRRLELGQDMARLTSTLDKVKKYERGLFKNIGGD